MISEEINDLPTKHCYDQICTVPMGILDLNLQCTDLFVVKKVLLHGLFPMKFGMQKPMKFTRCVKPILLHMGAKLQFNIFSSWKIVCVLADKYLVM